MTDRFTHEYVLRDLGILLSLQLLRHAHLQSLALSLRVSSGILGGLTLGLSSQAKYRVNTTGEGIRTEPEYADSDTCAPGTTAQSRAERGDGLYNRLKCPQEKRV